MLWDTLCVYCPVQSHVVTLRKEEFFPNSPIKTGIRAEKIAYEIVYMKRVFSRMCYKNNAYENNAYEA